MSDLERRALLGDQQAQGECTRQGIALSCPICHKPVKVSVSRMLYACASCHFIMSFSSFYVNPEDTLRIWNRRPAPPVGRCKDCAHYDEYRHCKQHSAEPDQYSPGHYVEMQPDDYCSYFEPKEKECKA